jgi:hypothetical protein
MAGTQLFVRAKHVPTIKYELLVFLPSANAMKTQATREKGSEINCCRQ